MGGRGRAPRPCDRGVAGAAPPAAGTAQPRDSAGRAGAGVALSAPPLPRSAAAPPRSVGEAPAAAFRPAAADAPGTATRWPIRPARGAEVGRRAAAAAAAAAATVAAAAAAAAVAVAVDSPPIPRVPSLPASAPLLRAAAAATAAAPVLAPLVGPTPASSAPAPPRVALAPSPWEPPAGVDLADPGAACGAACGACELTGGLAGGAAIAPRAAAGGCCARRLPVLERPGAPASLWLGRRDAGEAEAGAALWPPLWGCWWLACSAVCRACAAAAAAATEDDVTWALLGRSFGRLVAASRRWPSAGCCCSSSCWCGCCAAALAAAAAEAATAARAAAAERDPPAVGFAEAGRLLARTCSLGGVSRDELLDDREDCTSSGELLLLPTPVLQELVGTGSKMPRRMSVRWQAQLWPQGHFQAQWKVAQEQPATSHA